MPGLKEWLASPLGQYVMAREQAYFDQAVADAFGYRAIQIGFADQPFLRDNRIPWQRVVGLRPDADIVADPAQLPFAAQSLDLVLMPHTLDFTSHPHEVLREVERVLVPEGRLLLTGFNPVSLFGVRRVLTRAPSPWNGNFLSLGRLKDWLELLNFDIAGGAFLCYAPPLASDKWRDRFTFMEDAGDRWWPVASGVYALEAVKRVRGMRLIMPRWKVLAQPLIAVTRAKRPAMTPNEMLKDDIAD
ncbi:class I SAM-dependent methyltransferase [Microvirgula aerodenitrificans]|uniref:class I SAM-dependent methyltransferase n=1 Tax=Microvirgula aerodenitrificans TaxID=57480 RepID=UPI00048EF915|nr:methyltransferase domain-containing protein [Microvirgula aerodenitrificans]